MPERGGGVKAGALCYSAPWLAPQKGGKIVGFGRRCFIVLVMFSVDHFAEKSDLALMEAVAATLNAFAFASVALAFESAALGHAQKAAPDTPRHPGWPAGAPASQGGKFRPKTPDEIAADRAKGSQGKPPKSGRGMTEIMAEAVKTAIRAVLARAESAPDPRVRIVAALAEIGLEAYPYVSAYFDSAKTLEDLQAAAQAPRQTGYEDHHIVEQATANPDGSEAEKMDSPDNLARIPTAKHWELNRWYQRSNDDLNDETPREYLEGKSWDERRRIGLLGLRFVGVLK